MRIVKVFSVTLIVFSLALCSCKSSQQATRQTPISGANTPQPALQIVRGQQGGGLAYTAVAGASNQAGGLTFILRTVHNDCGEQPKIGQPFQFSGTQMVGMFFTVVNHSQGNEQLAGLALATLSGPNQVQAGLVFDDASRIGSTVNPLLAQLLSMWNPTAPAATGTGGASGGASAALARPQVRPSSCCRHCRRSRRLTTRPAWAFLLAGSWIAETAAMALSSYRHQRRAYSPLSMYRGGVDPTDPTQRQLIAEHYNVIPPGTVVYAFRGDIVHEFVPLFQAWRKAGGQGPAQINVVDEKSPPPNPGNPGNHCVMADGQMNPDGKGMQFFSCMMCASMPAPPPQGGGYSISLSNTMMPLAVAR